MRPNRHALLLAAISASIQADLSLPAPTRSSRIFTHADEERIAKAEAKRARKAAKRRKLAGKEPGNGQ